jgi:hypothetical protein
MTDVFVPLDIYIEPPIAAIPGSRVIHKSVTLTAAQQVITNYFGFGVLPAGHKLMACVLESADIDGATSHTISVGILNTYYGQAPATVAVPAAYSSGGATNTGTAPALVSGQNVLTASTVGQAGGRVYPSLAFTEAIGVDYSKDRIIALYFPAVGTSVEGKVGLIYTIDAA